MPVIYDLWNLILNRLPGTSQVNGLIEVCPVHPDCPFSAEPCNRPDHRMILVDWHIRVVHDANPFDFYETYERPEVFKARLARYEARSREPQICSREAGHEEGPCNGYPRPTCPGWRADG